MSSTSIERIAAGPAVGTPGRVGQATAVEQSRAIAEVQAAIVVAQQCPRDVPGAIAAMQDSCKQMALAERAFYRYNRGGVVTGASVHLARELARCWGNVHYTVAEMRRDDDAGQSEMIAYAWDLQTNARSSLGFVVPHLRDKKDGPVKLTDMRDVYENNANNGARRLREAIFSILPVWFTEEAKSLCSKTLTEGGGKPLQQRIAEALTAFDGIGVSRDELERKVGRPAQSWSAHDVAQLAVSFTSIQRGEINREDEFPPDRVTLDELTQPAAAPAARGRRPQQREQPPAAAAEQPAAEQYAPAGDLPVEEPPGWEG